jgi:hypothetical protein
MGGGRESWEGAVEVDGGDMVVYDVHLGALV